MNKPIKNYEDKYLILDTGVVKSIPRKTNNQFSKGRILKQYLSKSGYPYVTLKKNGKGHNYTVHRLVATHFLNGYFDKAQVNHKDENKENNDISNLEWVTCKENINYGVGIKKRAENQSIKIQQIDFDNKVVKTWKSINEAGRNSFSAGDITNCLKGRSKYHKNYYWRYL
jgi:hypothetical protein